MADPRADELARITDAIGGADGAAFVIVGDAGIGKTTLLNAVAREARARGTAVLGTRWSDDAGASPMWPWSRLVRDFVATHGAQALAEGHPLVRRLAEDVAAAAGLALPDPPADELAGRYAIGDGVGRLGGRAAPAVVLLEDLHYGSPANVAPLEPFAAAAIGMGAVVVATTRHAAGRRRRQRGVPSRAGHGRERSAVAARAC
ncbi:MAG: ATP-binding protein [Acidimicrobiales bacterium]|nr:ATP-binding protein [Acidimicrobiales bacterium]